MFSFKSNKPYWRECPYYLCAWCHPLMCISTCSWYVSPEFVARETLLEPQYLSNPEPLPTYYYITWHLVHRKWRKVVTLSNWAKTRWCVFWSSPCSMSSKSSSSSSFNGGSSSSSSSKSLPTSFWTKRAGVLAGTSNN